MISSRNTEKLKRIYLSRDGRDFDINADSWRLNKNVVVNVGWTSMLESISAESARLVLARSAMEYAATTVYGLSAECGAYIRKMGTIKFECDGLISFRSSLSRDEEHRLATIRMLIRLWCDWGHPGIPKDVMDLLNSWRLKGFEKGKAIKSLDAHEGPLTEIEMGVLIDAMLDAYVSGRLSLFNYALIGILVYSGRRPIQITSLKVKDICSRKSGEAREFWINFPRAKQRFSMWRSEFSKYPVAEDLWSVLQLHVNRVKEEVESIIKCEMSGDEVGELPLFPDFKVVRKCKNKRKLLSLCSSDEVHIERNVCNHVLQELGRELNVYSERTGEALNLATRRFRYTLGSNIAREGKGELIIAEALDHSDTQNVGVYVKNLPDVVERIDKAVAFQLAPLAQAFQGVLIDSEGDAVRGDDINSRIGNGQVNLGNCGSFGFCGALAPIACYTCKHFQPWLDGPHEIILDELIAKRDDVFQATNDIKIASSNDRLILAVSQVVKLCEEKKISRLSIEEHHG